MKKLSFLILLAVGIGFVSQITMAQSVNDEGRDYYLPTFKNFSQLYWALSKFELNDDEAVDNYMKINECDIYSDFINNEFEWRNIRETAKKQLEENKTNFPLRFEIMIPAEVEDYDFQKESFELTDDYKINTRRRFEIYATDYKDAVCDDRSILPGYPNGVLIELSRPFVFEELKIQPDKAKAYVDKKLQPYKEIIQQQGGVGMNIKRDIYIFLKIKFFAQRGEVALYANSRETLTKVLGVLESVEVYDTPQKDMLLMSENYRKKRKRAGPMKDLKGLSKQD